LKKIVAIRTERAHRDSGSPHAPDAGLCSEAANGRFAKKPTKARESDSILIESLRARANSMMDPNHSLRSAIMPTPHSQGISMQILSARHVKTEESLRLGVVSGWYSTKVSGTFVTGPHTTQEDCLSKIAELNPAPAKKKF
jgi:hypothetical protein